MSKTYIGLDLGSKTLGVAMSTSGIIAQTYDTFRFKENDYQKAIDYTLDLIDAHKPHVIVLGLPKHMNNDLGIRGEISMMFKKAIEAASDVNIILWDERLSTQSAMKAMMGAKKDTKKQKKDELAAVLILQNYLDATPH
jgi:putative holliday junction resolvase